ncbi:unnamed protein product [Arabis nemorensis]|uniref:Uncharacterized protein n=1 Tax=Arabis nemorensis TaxID=586526 RepID=A0A565BM23_9BRAS|nr:unnamed protein product [Arabis nemorensis]
MASPSIVPVEYPRRRYPVGKAPLLKRSLHHNCKLGDFEKMFEAVGEDVYNDIMNNHGVGVILKLTSWKMIWARMIIKDILSNELVTDMINEIWSLIGGRPVRFSLHGLARLLS